MRYLAPKNSVSDNARTTREVVSANFCFSETLCRDRLSHAAISRSSSASAGVRPPTRRSHRHRDIVDLRSTGAFRSALGGISATYHKEAAHQIDRLRTALVFARRYECSLSQ